MLIISLKEVINIRRKYLVFAISLLVALASAGCALAARFQTDMMMRIASLKNLTLTNRCLVLDLTTPAAFPFAWPGFSGLLFLIRPFRGRSHL